MTRRDLEQRLANTTWSRPPSDVPLATCWCGGAYLDTDLGADAHEVVMGHRPAKARDAGQPTDPAGHGTSPTNHQSAAPQARDPTSGHRQDDEPSDEQGR